MSSSRAVGAADADLEPRATPFRPLMTASARRAPSRRTSTRSEQHLRSACRIPDADYFRPRNRQLLETNEVKPSLRLVVEPEPNLPED